MRVFLKPDEYIESNSVEWTMWFYMSKLHASRDGKDLALELIEDYDGQESVWYGSGSTHDRFVAERRMDSRRRRRLVRF